MYTISYRNVLHADKQVHDFEQWLSSAWDVQKNWGADSVDYISMEDRNNHVCICRYQVTDINRWNQCNTGPEAVEVIQALGEIVDITRTSMKVTVTSLNM